MSSAISPEPQDGPNPSGVVEARLAAQIVSLRELNQRSGRIVAEVVASGRDAIVTDRGKPVARIVKEEPVESRLQELIRLGLVQSARSPFTWTEPIPAPSGRSTQEMIEWDRTGP